MQLFYKQSFKDQRVSSIKTRIKTQLCFHLLYKYHPQRVSSIKTRIKTLCFRLQHKNHLLLREYLPLKQGLRLLKFNNIHNNMHLREYLPLKQGLRPTYLVVFINNGWLREYLPLKQGLRPHGCLLSTRCVALREYLPLKQGLRHILIVIIWIYQLFSESIFH